MNQFITFQAFIPVTPLLARRNSKLASCRTHPRVQTLRAKLCVSDVATTRATKALEKASLVAMGVHATLLTATPSQAVPEAVVEAFKSKPSSLIHPAVMWALFATCGYTFYLGYQSSLIRSTEDKSLRKQLVEQRVSDRHFKTSSALFSIMTIATFAGMANTYARTGKLFPGPHLYAGLGLVATMSVMASFAPYMLKGKEWARSAHFSIAFLAFGLFAWQAKSGMVIVGKLLGWE